MAEFIHQSDALIAGLWHFTPDVVESFDEIVDSIWTDFEKERTRQIQADVKRQLKRSEKTSASWSSEEQEEWKKTTKKIIGEGYPHNRHERQLVIDLQSKRKCKVLRFSDALSDPDIQQELPLRFDLKAEAGRQELRVSLSRIGETSIRISVSPDTPRARSDGSNYAMGRGVQTTLVAREMA